MARAEHAGVMAQRGRDVVDYLVLADTIGSIEGHVHVVATGEPDPEHNRCHTLRLSGHPSDGRGRGTRRAPRLGFPLWTVWRHGRLILA